MPGRPMTPRPQDIPLRTGIVVIGRNEGARLVRCLGAVPPAVTRVICVDSGSTNGSLAAARATGAGTVALDLVHPFTAGRAHMRGLRP